MKNNRLLIHARLCLATEEAICFGIGEKKLQSMIEDYSHMGLFLQIGSKYTIKRKKFEEFLNDAHAI